MSMYITANQVNSMMGVHLIDQIQLYHAISSPRTQNRTTTKQTRLAFTISESIPIKKVDFRFSKGFDTMLHTCMDASRKKKRRGGYNYHLLTDSRWIQLWWTGTTNQENEVWGEGQVCGKCMVGRTGKNYDWKKLYLITAYDREKFEDNCLN